MEAGKLVDGVSLPILRAEKMAEHELVGAVLEGRQRLGIWEVAVHTHLQGDGVVSGENVLSLQSSGQTG